jgi:hypothetical protein
MDIISSDKALCSEVSQQFYKWIEQKFSSIKNIELSDLELLTDIMVTAFSRVKFIGSICAKTTDIWNKIIFMDLCFKQNEIRSERESNITMYLKSRLWLCELYSYDSWFGLAAGFYKQDNET